MVNKDVDIIIEDIHIELSESLICVTDIYNKLYKLKSILPYKRQKAHYLLEVMILDIERHNFNYNRFCIALDELEYSIFNY